MAGPWEDYKAAPAEAAPSSGPWSDYKQETPVESKGSEGPWAEYKEPIPKADKLGRYKAKVSVEAAPEGFEKLQKDIAALPGDMKAGVKAAIEGIPGAAGAVAGAEGGLALGAMTSPVTGPIGPIVGAIGGALVGGYLGHKTGESLKGMVPEETLSAAGFGKGQREVEKTQHPKASFAGELASSLPFFGPGKVGLLSRGFGAVVGGGMEAGTELATEGKIDPGKVAAAATFQGVFAKPTAITKAISDKLGNTARMAAAEAARDPAASETTKRDTTIKSTLDQFEAEAKADEAFKTKAAETARTKVEPKQTPAKVDQKVQPTKIKDISVEDVPEGFEQHANEIVQAINQATHVTGAGTYNKIREFAKKVGLKDFHVGGKLKDTDSVYMKIEDYHWGDTDERSLMKYRVEDVKKANAAIVTDSISSQSFLGYLRSQGFEQIEPGKWTVGGKEHTSSRHATKPAPLVEAAIRDKKTGAVERMGPKHDEARKAETKDTHEQGFLDGAGNFLERKEALKRARETEQLAKGKKLDFPDEGLHSGDLRASGDPAFQLDKPRQPKEVKTKLDREKESWSKEDKPKKALKPKPESTDPMDTAGRTDVGETGAIEPRVKDVKTKGPKDESKIHASIARKIYHTKGLEAAKSYLETVTPHASVVVEDIKDRIGINLNNVDANQRLTNIFKSDIIKLVPNAAERSALPAAIEHGLPLEGDAAKAVNLYKIKMDQIGKMAEKAQVIRGLVENYVTRMARKAGIKPEEEVGFIQSILKSPGVQEGLKPGSQFGKERKIESLEQAREAMAKQGIELESDLAEIAHGYMTDMYKAIEDKNLFNKLKVTKIDDKYAIVDPRSKEDHYGYKVIDHGPFAGWFVHPDIKPALNFVLGASEPGPWMKSILTVNNAIKRSNISASLFHAKSLAEAFVMARPYLGEKVGQGSLSSVLKILREGGMGDVADLAIREGGVKLGMSSVEDVSHTAIEEIGKMADKLLGAYSDKKIIQSALGRAEKETLGRIDSFTWDYVHDGLKLLTFSKLLDQAVHDHPNVPKEVHAKEIGRFVNNSFGGLNWYDIARQSSSKFEESMKMASYSPEGRRVLQAVIFAPDWTVSTLRSFTTALPKNLLSPDIVGGAKGLLKPKTQGDFARLYQMKFALLYLTALNGVNIITSGHPIWDNKDKTRVEFKDGTTMQATKHAMEFIHFASDTDKFISDKLGFLPKAFVISTTGLEYAGPGAQKLEDPSLVGRAKAVGKSALPFNVQAWQGAPQGEQLQRMLLGTLGMPIYGKTKMQQAKDNYEKRRRMMERKMKDAQDE